MVFDALYISILSLLVGGGGDLNGIITGLDVSYTFQNGIWGYCHYKYLLIHKKSVASI